jgi:hypothetical protein
VKKRAYPIAKTAEQLVEAIQKKEYTDAEDRIIELENYLKESGHLGEFKKTIEDVKFGIDQSEHISEPENTIDISGIRTIKYRFITELVEEPSGADLTALKDINVDIESIDTPLSDEIGNKLDSSERINRVIERDLIERFDLRVSTEEFPEGVKTLFAIILIEFNNYLEKSIEDFPKLIENSEVIRENIHNLENELESTREDLIETSLDQERMQEIQEEVEEVKELRSMRDDDR